MIKFIPYWAVPLTLIFGEMAFIFKRRGNKPRMMRMLVLSGFFLILTVLFFVFRWDVVAYPWLESALYPR